MHKAELYTLVLSKSFAKVSDYPEAYESEDRSVVVVFDTYFRDNFEVMLPEATFPFSSVNNPVALCMVQYVRGSQLKVKDEQ